MNKFTMRETDILKALREEKARVKKELQKSEKLIARDTRSIFAPVPRSAGRFQLITSLASNGLAIYQGLRIGSGIIRAASTLFRRHR